MRLTFNVYQLKKCKNVDVNINVYKGPSSPLFGLSQGVKNTSCLFSILVPPPHVNSSSPFQHLLNVSHTTSLGPSKVDHNPRVNNVLKLPMPSSYLEVNFCSHAIVVEQLMNLIKLQSKFTHLIN
jgi:hypothetical protein